MPIFFKKAENLQVFSYNSFQVIFFSNPVSDLKKIDISLFFLVNKFFAKFKVEFGKN